MANLITDWERNGYRPPYVEDHRLGEGADGTAYRVARIDTGSPRAAKISHRKTAPWVLQEAQLIQRMGPIPHAVTMEAHFPIHEDGDVPRHVLISHLATSSNSGQTENAHELIGEYGINAFSIPQIVSSIAQVLEALVEFQKRGMLHADLKPANLMINRDSGQTTLLDPGCAVALATPPNQIVTTPMYRPPERFLGKREPSPTYDMWSLGVALCEFYAGQTPFPYISEDPDPPLKSILTHLGPPTSSYLETCENSSLARIPCDASSRDYWKVIIQEAARQREDDPTLLIDFLEKIFCYEGRMTPEDALKHPFLSSDCHIKVDVTRLSRAQQKTSALLIGGLQIPLSSPCSCIHFPRLPPNEQIRLLSQTFPQPLARWTSADTLTLSMPLPSEEEKFTPFQKKAVLQKSAQN